MKRCFSGPSSFNRRDERQQVASYLLNLSSKSSMISPAIWVKACLKLPICGDVWAPSYTALILHLYVILFDKEHVLRSFNVTFLSS